MLEGKVTRFTYRTNHHEYSSYKCSVVQACKQSFFFSDEICRMVWNVEESSLCRAALCFAGHGASLVSVHPTSQKFLSTTIRTATLEIHLHYLLKSAFLMIR